MCSATAARVAIAVDLKTLTLEHDRFEKDVIRDFAPRSLINEVRVETLSISARMDVGLGSLTKRLDRFLGMRRSNEK
jgi:hypothetical protein